MLSLSDISDILPVIYVGEVPNVKLVKLYLKNLEQVLKKFFSLLRCISYITKILSYFNIYM